MERVSGIWKKTRSKVELILLGLVTRCPIVIVFTADLRSYLDIDIHPLINGWIQ